MIKFLYALYDCVAKEYAAPFMANNDGSAARSFSLWLSKHADQINGVDYKLFCVGSFDVESGEVEPTYKEIAMNEGEDL